jgi:hypothetical protein
MKNDMNSNLYPSPPPGSPPPISIDCNKSEQYIISLPPPPTQGCIERLRIMNENIPKKQCSSCKKELTVIMFMSNNPLPTLCCNCDTKDDDTYFDTMIKNGVGESQDKLVEFLLYDDRIRGVDDIEWNNFGYYDSDDDEFEDDEEREEHNNYQREEALQCFSWYRLNDYYKDIFDDEEYEIPTYSFKNETWVLNVNNILKRR